VSERGISQSSELCCCCLLLRLQLSLPACLPSGPSLYFFMDHHLSCLGGDVRAHRCEVLVRDRENQPLFTPRYRGERTFRHISSFQSRRAWLPPRLGKSFLFSVQTKKILATNLALKGVVESIQGNTIVVSEVSEDRLLVSHHLHLSTAT